MRRKIIINELQQIKPFLLDAVYGKTEVINKNIEIDIDKLSEE